LTTSPCLKLGIRLSIGRGIPLAKRAKRVVALLQLLNFGEDNAPALNFVR
jgi:hypothetical protein